MPQSLIVLIVDDDPTNFARMEIALRPLGCTTQTASSGAEALAILAKFRGRHGFPGIMITDLKMPVMDGLELLKRVQVMDDELPIMIVSAYGEISVAVNAMRLGAQDFIERPIDFDILRTRVTLALEFRRRVLARREQNAERASRRLAAILMADAVGYSRMSHSDEEGTRLHFRDLQRSVFEPRISEGHGRLVKTLGDGLLVEFPSVVNALRCAMEIQSSLARGNAALPRERQMHFRIAINLGDVIVESDDLLGDGVNTASRLQALAEAGGIVVSQSTYEQVRNKIEVDFECLGEQLLKNIDEPVKVYRVVLSAHGVWST